MKLRYTQLTMATPTGLLPPKLPLRLRLQTAALRFMSHRSEKTLVKAAKSQPPVIRGRRLDPVIHLIAQNGKGQRPMHTMTPPEARLAMEMGFSMLDASPRAMKQITHHDIEVNGGTIPVYVYQPKAQGPLPVLCYYHQGGCCIGSPRVVHSWCSQLAEELPAIVVNVGYRLLPEHQFPAPLDDAITAYRWARDHATEWGGDPKRMAVGGDSAGGFLSAAVVHHLHDDGEPQPIGQLLIYPWTSLDPTYPSYADYGSSFPLDTSTLEWFRSQSGPDVDQADHMHLSPVHREHLAGLAPAMVVTAGFCPLCDEGDHYAERLKAAGVPVHHRRYDSLSHSFTAFGGAVPAARAALKEITSEFRNILNSGGV